MSANPPSNLTDANGFFVFGSGSNLRKGTNPPYAASDFLSWYPQFGNDSAGNPVVPAGALQNFIEEAQASVQKARFRATWPRAMALFIAHQCQLYVQTTASTGTTAEQVLQDGKFQGVVTAKSVGDVSVSYDTNVTGRDTPTLQGWGDFHLTEYGVQFATLAKRYALGNMYVY